MKERKRWIEDLQGILCFLDESASGGSESVESCELGVPVT
jgi:hypothetical protein